MTGQDEESMDLEKRGREKPAASGGGPLNTEQAPVAPGSAIRSQHIAEIMRSAGRLIEFCGLLLQDEGAAPAAPKPGVPGGGYTFPHLVISGEVSRHWLREEGLPKRRGLVWGAATGALAAAMKKLNDSGVLQDIETQLAKDSKDPKKPLKLSVEIEIEEDNYFQKDAISGLAAVTFSGDPTTIFINIGVLADGTEEEILKALIHELLHAKDGAYTDAGQPSPYPQGHNDPAFKAAEKRLLDKAEGR